VVADEEGGVEGVGRLEAEEDETVVGAVDAERVEGVAVAVEVQRITSAGHLRREGPEAGHCW
jgi:hypothetical protein